MKTKVYSKFILHNNAPVIVYGNRILHVRKRSLVYVFVTRVLMQLRKGNVE